MTNHTPGPWYNGGACAEPELLEALEGMVSWFGTGVNLQEVNYDAFDSGEINESLLDWFGLHKVLDRATAAIAKAKGEESFTNVCPECDRDLGPEATSCQTCSADDHWGE